jgi:hypothetical protein
MDRRSTPVIGTPFTVLSRALTLSVGADEICVFKQFKRRGTRSQCGIAGRKAEPSPSNAMRTDVISTASWRHHSGASLRLGSRLVIDPHRSSRYGKRETRLLAIAPGLAAAADIGLKAHDRLALARQMMERKLAGRCTFSKLPELIEPIMARPLASAGTVAATPEVTQQALCCFVAGPGGQRNRFRDNDCRHAFLSESLRLRISYSVTGTNIPSLMSLSTTLV